MTGQREIEQLRREGMRPVAVFLLDYPEGRKHWPVIEQIREGSIPALYIDVDDPATADCRFVLGLRVHLHCDEAARATAWVDRLLTDGARHVIQTTRGEVFQWRA